MFKKGIKDRITYYSCGHSSEGESICIEENQTVILEMIEKGAILASGEFCPKCSEKEKSAQTIRVLQQTGILPD